ncbi:MAG: primosomal protein N', partial [Chlorobiaceae bacterium]|nr:primosomal protein N' [Chlorobiaceae bacterium]
PGSMVMVTSGKGNKATYPAYILRLFQDNADNPEDLFITDILYDGKPVLNHSLLKLTAWMAEYYITAPLDTITSALPLAVRTTVNDIVELSGFQLQAAMPKIVNTSLRRAILKLMSQEKKLTVRQLEKRLGKKDIYRALHELEQAGLLTLQKKFSSTTPKEKTAYRLSVAIPENIELLLHAAPKQLEAFTALRTFSHAPVFPETLGISRDILNALVKKGLAEKVQVELSSTFKSGFSERSRQIDTLSSAQQNALQTLTEAYEKQEFATFLLHGVTGSGKTLVYIEFLKKVIASGKTAIVLVPEIALTPQTAARFRNHFHDDITILHSAMSDREKYDAWHNLRLGKTKIALGARSTVFAPLDNLGAIIVDEEHDGAYKQDRNPRYQGRDTAIMRAMFENALCVLGTATPSFESYHNALTGKYTLINLPERVDGATMPSIKLIWMRDNPKASRSISEKLYQAIKTRLEKNEQVILLQNRRGFAGSVFCLDCGHTPSCKFCNIPLVYHSGEQHLRCHYCGFVTLFSDTCSSCSSKNLLYKSSGTERIEEELNSLFPDESILRMDVDTTSSKDAHAKILRDFHEKKSRILLGTQMVAKGLDFPDVTLVGVLMADIGLNIPDFRASERLFSLLTQVSGRAGRSSKSGEVLLQVFNKDAELFASLLKNSYTAFFEQEMSTRKALYYPPFSKLVKFEFSSPDEKKAEEASSAWAAILRPSLTPETGILLGPAPAGMAKLKGLYRYHVLVKLLSGKLSPAFLRNELNELGVLYRKEKLTISIDVDPQNLL